MSTDTNESNTPAPGSDEYNAEMAQKADDLNTAANPETTQQDSPVKPDDVPEKFWDAENGVVNYKAWADSTKELEGKLTQQSQEGEESTDEPPADEDVDTSQVSDGDFDRYSQEFLDNGELSEDTYTELQSKGIPRSYVDAYISGQQALAETKRTQMLSDAGFSGQEDFDRATKWAVANMSETQLNVYNQAVESKDAATVTEALKSLATSYRNAKGSTQSTLLNGDAPQTSGDVFESTAQMMAAMSDPRYKADPAYRKQVEQKIGRSNIL